MTNVSATLIGLNVFLILVSNNIQLECKILRDQEYETYAVDSHLPQLDNLDIQSIVHRSKRETTNLRTSSQSETAVVNDYHEYYNSTTYVDKVEIDKYWEDFKDFTTIEFLSGSHRRGITVQLSFDFPFYGHPIRNVTVATGGFLFTGEFVHAWLAATQYIAPLMANFDLSISNDTVVKYKDDGTSFTVIWENVILQDHPEIGKFTFSASLFNTGDIKFAYYSVPAIIELLPVDKHPVSVGLSDAYIIDTPVFHARRKTLYEYHRINFGNADIRNGTFIYLNALETCVSATECEACLTNFPQFSCGWCPALNRCSSGMERRRQEWLNKSCDKIFLTDKLICLALDAKDNNAVAQENQNFIEVHILSRGGFWYPNGTYVLPEDLDDSVRSLQSTRVSAQRNTSDFGLVDRYSLLPAFARS